MAELNDTTPNEELPLYMKLLVKQQEDLEMEVKKIISMTRQVVATENKIDRLKKQIRETAEPIQESDSIEDKK